MSAEGEINRRVSDVSIDAITDAAIYRIMTPKRYSGYETTCCSPAPDLRQGNNT